MLRQMVRPAVHLVVGGPSLVASECRESGCCAGCICGSSLKQLLLWRAVVTPVCAAVAPSSSQQPEPGTAAEQCQAVAWDAAVPYSTGRVPHVPLQSSTLLTCLGTHSGRWPECLGLLPSTWETWLEFLAPGSGLAQTSL